MMGTHEPSWLMLLAGLVYEGYDSRSPSEHCQTDVRYRSLRTEIEDFRPTCGGGAGRSVRRDCSPAPVSRSARAVGRGRRAGDEPGQDHRADLAGVRFEASATPAEPAVSRAAPESGRGYLHRGGRASARSL